jgi:hypothetical protein
MWTFWSFLRTGVENRDVDVLPVGSYEIEVRSTYPSTHVSIELGTELKNVSRRSMMRRREGPGGRGTEYCIAAITSKSRRQACMDE